MDLRVTFRRRFRWISSSESLEDSLDELRYSASRCRSFLAMAILLCADSEFSLEGLADLGPAGFLDGGCLRGTVSCVLDGAG